MSEVAEVVPSGAPDWEEVFAGLSSVTAGSPANLAGYYLDRVAAIEQAWAAVPGLKGELRVGGTAFPADLVRWAAVAFDSMAIYPFGGGAQRVQWLTREGFSNSIGDATVAINLRADEAKALLGSTRDPRIRVAVAMREDAATRSLLEEVAPLVAKARLWVRPRRVVLVQSGPGLSEDNWRLRDADSASLEEVWSVPARGGAQTALPIRLGPVSARETELFRVPVPFLSGIALPRLEAFLAAESEQVARCRMSLDLAVSEVRREGFVTQRLLDGLVRSEWDKLTSVFASQRATLGVATLSLVAVRLAAGESRVTLSAKSLSPVDRPQGPGAADSDRSPLVELGLRPEGRVFHYLWRCWGMQRLARARVQPAPSGGR